MSHGRVIVVTDSTAYLPEELIDKYDLTVVPLQVCVPGAHGAEGSVVTPAMVTAALSERRVSVTTSRPSPQDFVTAYTDAAARWDATAIVSVHLSAALSGTVDAARAAARQVRNTVGGSLDVHVVDTRSLTMGEGFPVLAAAEVAAAGGGVDEVVAAAQESMARTRTIFYVDTLDHLRRGGRIGAASALVGTALMVKPLLHVLDGQIAPLEKLRTTSKALARLEALVLEHAGDEPVDLAVHHLDAPARASELADRLRYRMAGVQSVYVSEVGAVIGAHVGPGMLGVVLQHR